MLRLKGKYQKEVIPAMMEKFGYSNRMAVPKIEKIVINTGLGRLVAGKTSEEQKNLFEAILNDLTLITAQRAVLTQARKSIASFKVRKGMSIGAKITLRGTKIYDFLERIIHIALPRSRDFQGIDLKSFDEQGNLTIALKEQIVFPEISAEKTKLIFGFELSIVTNAKTREESIELLRLLGIPIKK